LNSLCVYCKRSLVSGGSGFDTEKELLGFQVPSVPHSRLLWDVTSDSRLFSIQRCHFRISPFGCL